MIKEEEREEDKEYDECSFNCNPDNRLARLIFGHL